MQIIFFSEGFTKVVYEDKYGYIDKSGREVVEPIYDYVSNIKDNMLVVVKGDKVGLLKINQKLDFKYAYLILSYRLRR